jgi:acetyltransferase
VRDGRTFFNALKSCAAKKPVVIMKGGLSDEGYRGTMGHTGSMAGTRQAWEGAIKSAGAVIAYNMLDLVECMMAFNCLEGYTGGGVGILAGGGSRAVESLDAATRNGISVPILDEKTCEEIQACLPPVGGKGGNPADLFGPGVNAAVMIPIMDIFAKTECISGLVMYGNLFNQLNARRKMPSDQKDQVDIFEVHQKIAEKAVEIRKNIGKPLSVILLDCASNPEHSEIEQGRFAVRYFYTTRGIPCFDTASQTFSILKRIGDYYKRRNL